ncbi:hypothetical protein Acr_24g0007790 [Actinidia rufa]|uniref:DUF4283 domain-containing protein n=1 Tax=Actinidia rufa TaxID=165716 RepID=A0A7J0GUS3_9ERIC|nr:hypothetical protein Acr_24g0007790 [Actinidia rufa]
MSESIVSTKDGVLSVRSRALRVGPSASKLGEISKAEMFAPESGVIAQSYYTAEPLFWALKSHTLLLSQGLLLPSFKCVILVGFRVPSKESDDLAVLGVDLSPSGKARTRLSEVFAQEIEKSIVSSSSGDEHQISGFTRQSHKGKISTPNPPLPVVGGVNRGVFSRGGRPDLVLEEIREVRGGHGGRFSSESRGGFRGRVPNPMGFDICPGLDERVSENSQNPMEPSSGVGLSQSQSESLSKVNKSWTSVAADHGKPQMKLKFCKPQEGNVLHLERRENVGVIGKNVCCSSRDNVIDLDPWHIGGQPIRMRKWQRMLKLSKDTVKDIPVWVKFYNVPFEVWDEEVLTVLVEYQLRLPRCAHCKTCGHLMDECPKIPKVDKPTQLAPVMEWQQVSKKGKGVCSDHELDTSGKEADVSHVSTPVQNIMKAGLAFTTKIEPKRTRPSMKVLPFQQHARDMLSRLRMRERSRSRAQSIGATSLVGAGTAQGYGGAAAKTARVWWLLLRVEKAEGGEDVYGAAGGCCEGCVGRLGFRVRIKREKLISVLWTLLELRSVLKQKSRVQWLSLRKVLVDFLSNTIKHKSFGSTIKRLDACKPVSAVVQEILDKGVWFSGFCGAVAAVGFIPNIW